MNNKDITTNQKTKNKEQNCYKQIIAKLGKTDKETELREEFKKLLKLFNVEQKWINLILKNKKIIKIKENIFIVNKQYTPKKEEVFLNHLLFIKTTNKLLPSEYLLNYIMLHSKTTLKIKDYKKALKITYSKIPKFNNKRIEELQKTFNQNSEEKYIIIKFEELPIGILKIGPKNRIENIMNIGEYLKE